MAKKPRHKLTRAERSEAAVGYAFVLPYLVAFVIFTGIPFISAFLMSFVNIKFISKLDNLKFMGIDNFIRIFTTQTVRDALFRTFIYSLIYVPVIMVVSFVLAYLLNKGVYAVKPIRSMVFLPYVSNMIAVAIVWQIMLGPRGPLYAVQKLFGAEQPLIPLLSPQWALPTVVLISVWKSIGLNFLTYLGALQGVSQDLIEAAEMDGANKWQQITNVVIPSVSPTTFFLLISSIITSLQNFTVIQGLTGGGPGESTWVMSLSIYNYAFTKFDTSFAAAQALLMFAVVMVITLIQWRGQKKWVNY